MRDRYKDKTVHGMNNIMLDILRHRYDSEVYMNAKIDVTDFCKYIDKVKKEHPDVTYFHGMLMILGKTLYSRPLLNRFVANRTMYMHKTVSFGFTAKAQFDDESLEYMALIDIKPEDTLLDISETIRKKVETIRANRNDGGANDLVDMFGNSPKLIRGTVVKFFEFLDRHGWLPASVCEGLLYYSSAIVSNIGVFKVGAIHHHLADFGTASSLITMGEIVTEGDKKYMEMGITLDERIADGFYFCKALKLIEYMFANPEVMMEPASLKVSISTTITGSKKVTKVEEKKESDDNHEEKKESKPKRKRRRR